MPVRIRDLTEYDDLLQCVTIQQRTWGSDFSEIVPAAILWIATRTGGIVAGAFDDTDTMIGFLFGLSGFRDGRPVHWSDMLAVAPEARGAGVGQALKAHQRTTLLSRGIREACWTFDPLESRNAHINLCRLGGFSREYIRDCYGASHSPLHAGLPTDRLVITWNLDAPRVRKRMEGSGSTLDMAGAALINERLLEPRTDLVAPLLRLRIPADIQRIKAEAPDQALAWRYAVRTALECYIGKGYAVTELVREESAYSSYLLVRDDAANAALSR
jgi:predicted GNAT superfamily acetyltransferase